MLILLITVNDSVAVVASATRNPAVDVKYAVSIGERIDRVSLCVDRINFTSLHKTGSEMDQSMKSRGDSELSVRDS